MVRIDELSAAAQQALATETEGIQIWVNSNLGATLFRVLLQKLRSGVPVELALADRQLDTLDITAVYLEKFQSAGGTVLWCPDHPFSQSFILLDRRRLLLEHQLPGSTLDRLAPVDDDTLLKKCLAAFDAIKQRATLFPAATVRRRATGAATAPNGPYPGPTAATLAVHFRSSPPAVEVNEPFQLHWRVTGADRVHIDRGIGEVPPRGSKQLRARQDAEFVLTASNRWESISRITLVRVNPAVKIHYRVVALDHAGDAETPLNGVPDFPDRIGIIEGQLVRIYWEIFNARETRLAGEGSIPAEGFRDLAPANMTLLHFVATGEEETVERKVVFHVFALPPIATPSLPGGDDWATAMPKQLPAPAEDHQPGRIASPGRPEPASLWRKIRRIFFTDSTHRP